MTRDWRPVTGRAHYGRKPPVGVLIGHQHEVWRVTAVEPLIPGDWSERAREKWLNNGMPDPWESAPFRVVVTKPGDRNEVPHAMTVEPWHYHIWHIVPEHYAVCVKCAEPAPCREHLRSKQAADEMRQAETALSLPPGCCPACQEPITTRQKTHRFPGANLLNPLGPDNVEFHARRKCWDSARRYERQWVAADPTRPRSLLTLTCTGTVIAHCDGTAECVARSDGSDCPNIYAEHGRYKECGYQTHGCPRLECAGLTGQGCRPPKGLNPDGTRPTQGEKT